MVPHCHRCAGALEEDAVFCPHCAAPQLRVSPAEETPEAAPGPGLASGPGQIPGPAQTFFRDRRTIDWHNVLRLALAIAIPAGLLAPFFFPLVIAAPVAVIALYHRRRPGSQLDGRNGFRIGALTGLLSAYVASFGLAGWQLFERYAMHQGSALDAQYAQQIQQSADATQHMAQSGSLNPQQARAMLDFFLSPDGRATFSFFSTAILASGIVLLAGLGGMLGARLSRRSAPLR